MLSSVVSVSAREIPASQAAQIAQSFSKTNGTTARRVQSSVQPVLIHVEADAEGHNLFYVFNRPGLGYIIVAADDVARQVLAYSDTNELTDFNAVPANMRNMLRDYAQQIISVRARNGAKAPAQKARQAIAALTQMEWNQTDPFNCLMPTVEGESAGETQLAVTGCVATAMAQVLKYYEYPAQGKGSESYTDIDGETYSTNFAEHTYDYSIMPNVYDDATAQASKDAVAQLMYDCAVAVHMHFDKESSASYTSDVPEAMIEHFGFDKAALYEARTYYTDEQWEDKVYAELVAGRPVMYAANSTEGGHTFLIDGSDENGLFHVNWGWGGFENGFFALTGAEVLNPNGGGTGGSDSKVSYNQAQHAIFGLQPDKGNDYQVSLICDEPVKINVTEVTRPVNAADAMAWIELSGKFTNLSLQAQATEYAIRMVNTANQEEKIIIQNAEPLTLNGTGLGYTSKIMIHQSEVEWLADGDYSVEPLWRVSGTAQWQSFDYKLGMQTQAPLTLTLKNGHVFWLTRKVEVEKTAADGIVARVYLHADKEYHGYIRPFIAESTISEAGEKQWLVMQYSNGTYLFDSKSTKLDLAAGEDKEVVLGPFAYDTYKYGFDVLLRLRISDDEEVTRDDTTPDAVNVQDVETIFTMTPAELNPVKIYNAGNLTVASGAGDNLVFSVPVHANLDVKGKLAVHVFRVVEGSLNFDPNGADQNIPAIDIDLKAGTDTLITISGRYISDAYNFDALARVYFSEDDEFNYSTLDQMLVPVSAISQAEFKVTDPVNEFLLTVANEFAAVSSYCDSLTFSISLYSNKEKDIWLVIPEIYQWYEGDDDLEADWYLFVDDDFQPLAAPYVKQVHLNVGVNTFRLGPIVYKTDEYNIGGLAELYFSEDGTWDLDDVDFFYNNYLGTATFEIDVPVGVQNIAVEQPAASTSSSDVYSITGQRVARNTRNLPRGLYIVNGKKILVK